MPVVPVKAAGWRIEPPVSVAVAPRQSSAATAAAEPPEEPPGVSGWFDPRLRQGFVRRAHRELVEVELAQHHRPVAPEIGGDGRLVRRLEVAEDVGAGGR